MPENAKRQWGMRKDAMGLWGMQMEDISRRDAEVERTDGI